MLLKHENTKTRKKDLNYFVCSLTVIYLYSDFLGYKYYLFGKTVAVQCRITRSEIHKTTPSFLRTASKCHKKVHKDRDPNIHCQHKYFESQNTEVRIS